MNDEKENDLIIRKKVFENILIAIAVIIYFMIINFACIKNGSENVAKVLGVISFFLVILCISIFEAAYNRDSGKIAIYGIEVLFLAIYTLLINNVTKKNNYDFEYYVLFSSYLFSIYYVLKAILIYTNEKRKYLKSLSDIHEIVSNKPIKKEARRRTIK